MKSMNAGLGELVRGLGEDAANPHAAAKFVEARLIDAFDTLAASPDRERGWLRGVTMALWREVRPEWGDYVEVTPGRPGVSRYAIRRMDETLGWCARWLDGEDRRLIARVIERKRRGKRAIWPAVRRDLGVETTTDALRMRYERALRVIAAALSDEAHKANSSSRGKIGGFA